MSELGVGPDDAVLKVVCFTNEGTWVKLEETPLPPPLVVGPSFTSTTAEISKTAGGKSDVKAVQAKLTTLGFYTGAVDGIFGDATAAAVSAFQTFAKLDVTGTANGTTKRVLLKPRFDLEKDVNLQDGDKANFEPGSTITYVVGPTPGYLEREQVLKEIAAGFRAWAGPAASGLKFKRVPAKSPKAAAAQLTIDWADNSDDNPSKFDGPGGKLADADKEGVLFDASERWLLQGAEPRPMAFYLLPVLVHEIGHVLGLVHSDDPTAVMSPWYVEERISLTDNDRGRVAKLYGAPGPAAAAAAPAAPPTSEWVAEYVGKHQLEVKLSDALNSAIGARAERPLKHVAEYLLKLDAEQQ